MFVISARDKILGSFVVQNCAALLEIGIEKRPITGYMYFQYHEMYAASSLHAQTFLSDSRNEKMLQAMVRYHRIPSSYMYISRDFVIKSRYSLC